MRFTSTLGLGSLLFASTSLATGYTVCVEPLPSECSSSQPGKRDAFGLMYKRALFPRTCPPDSGPATHCTPGGPTYENTIDLQCGSKYEPDPLDPESNDLPGAVLNEITDCPASVATGKCYHTLVTVDPLKGTIYETYLDIRLIPGTNPQDSGSHNLRQYCSPGGECWVPLQAIADLFSISSPDYFCSHAFYAANHVNIHWVWGEGDTCFPRDQDPTNNSGFGNAWFIAQKIQFTCSESTCCCCPITTPSDKFCSIGTGFGVPKECSPNQICTTNTLGNRGCGRWGWYHNIASIPYGPVDFHVGAGKNDLRKGESAGTVEVKTCSSGSGICAFYVMNPGYRLNSAHVDSQCGLNSIAHKTTSTNGYPCAPGSYNTNEGGECPGFDGLGATWESEPLASCNPTLPISAIFHGTVSKELGPGDEGYGTCIEGCGDSDIGE